MRILNLPWPPGLLGDSSQCALSLSVPPRVPSKHSRHLCLGRISSIAAARDNGIARSLVLHAMHCRGGRDAGRVLGRVPAVLSQQLHQVCARGRFVTSSNGFKFHLSNANIDPTVASGGFVDIAPRVTQIFCYHCLLSRPWPQLTALHLLLIAPNLLAAFTMAAATMPLVDACAPNTISPAPIARPRS
jgi:hypothetical protein